MNRAPLIVVLYDSITNSVFQSQVLQPLLTQRKQHPYQPIIIISFEKHRITQEQLKKIIPKQSIKLIIKKRAKVAPLWFAQKTLRDFLFMIPEYQLLARGPHAGFICLRVADKHCEKITIQARGLVAQEYRFAHQNSPFFLKAIHGLRARKLQRLERFCFASKKNNLEIQAVSTAMKDYLVKTYKADPKKITLATCDIPATIQPAQIAQWKQETRKRLHISDDAYVYCYNGSAKPWQCIDLVLSFFKEKLEENPRSFLLVLTQDRTLVKNKIAQQMIPEKHYTVLSVEYNDIYTYLSVADAGILFRDKHIINWVSRPTKLLEYKAVGLKIIHNNTVAYAQE